MKRFTDKQKKPEWMFSDLTKRQIDRLINRQRNRYTHIDKQRDR